MLEDFEFEKDFCPVCIESKLALILFNAISNPEDWISIVDGDMGDSRLIRIENLFGMSSEEALENGFAPTGFTSNTVHNFVRSVDHFYEFLKSIKGYV